MALVHRVSRWQFMRREAGALFWSTIWLAYLTIPVVELWASGARLVTKLLMTALLAVFVVCYVGFWALCIVGGRRTWRLPAAGLVLLVAIVAAVVGSSFGLGYALVYAAAALAAALAPRFRLSVAGVLAVAALAVLIGLFTGAYLWNIVLEGMITLSSGGGVLAYVAMEIQNDKLRCAREEIARLAVSEERLRFSRDLHDLLGHSLSVIVLKAELAHRMAERSPERTAQEVADIEKVAREALHEVREAVSGYRQQNLSQELDTATQTLRGAGVQVQVAGGPGTLASPLDAALAWAVREATTNVIRHAQARRVRFDFTREAETVRLRVVNDGVPSPAGPTSEGNGLRGLRERLRALGGDLSYGAGQTDGFTLTATLPVSVVEAPATPAVA